MRIDRYRPNRFAGLVPEIWEQRAARPLRWRILPSGWVELIFRLGPAFRLRNARRLDPDSGPIRQFCFLSGLHTRPLDLAFDRFHVFGVRLHPVAVRAFFGMPCSEVRDGAVEGALLLDGLARIEDRLRAAPDFAARARWMERELAERLRRGAEPDTALRMVGLAHRLPMTAAMPARELHRRLGYSRSHAHRLFREWFGQSATGVVRLSRFVRAVDAVHGGRGTLTALAHRLGYFDQSHFIREFREFSGMTPGEYRRRRGAAPGQLPL